MRQYQFRLGHQYYPHQPHTESLEFYWSHLLASNRGIKGSDMSPLEFEEVYHATKQTFERSSLLKYSGLPINNSRTMSFLGEYNTLQTPATTELHSFLKHVTVSRAFLNNLVQSI